MKEIKFRSWNEREKIMEIPYNIANGIDGEKYQIMQYTGLKDKNGKEIYEGDIVRHTSYYVGDGWYPAGVSEIVFAEGCYCIHNECVLDSAAIQNVGVRIIGNVMENPELLK